VGGQGQQDFFDHARADPVLETPMDGLVRAVSVGQVVPRRTSAQNPQHPVQNRASVTPRPASAIRPHWIVRQDCRDEFPLFVRQFPTKSQSFHPPIFSRRIGHLLSNPDL
jgi:hypothetical protein